MAPEQTAAGASITPRTDVWPLGLIAFQALTGCHYWKAAADETASMATLLREIVLEPIPPASARAAELGRAQLVPPPFDGWFARCVAREPGERFADAAEAMRALEATLRTEGPRGATETTGAARTGGVAAEQASPALATSGPVEDEPPESVAGVPSPRRGRRIVVAAGALAIVGTLAAAGLLGWRALADKDRPYDDWQEFGSRMKAVTAPPDVMLPEVVQGMPIDGPPPFDEHHAPATFDAIAQSIGGREGYLPWASTVVTVSRHVLHVEPTDLTLTVPEDAPLHGFDQRVKRMSRTDLYVVPLGETLMWLREQWRKLAMAAGKDPAECHLTLLADRDVSYRLLTEIMYTAGQSEYSQLHVVGRHAGRLVAVESHPARVVRAPLPRAKPRLSLNVVAVKEGFVVSAFGQRVGEGCNGTGTGVAIPAHGTTYDYGALVACAKRLADQSGDDPENRTATLSAAADVSNEVVLETASALEQNDGHPWFDIEFGVPR
jgi:hypothetical protein